MSADDFECPPSVELLRYLAGESLRQPDVLSVAVRLWVMLRSLYGADGDPVKLDLEQVFSFTDWRQKFFAGYNHPMDDAIPEIHDRRCPCAKTLEQWLFEPKTGIPQKEWQKAFFQHYPIPEAEMDRLLCPVKWVFDPETGIPESEWRQSFYKKFTPEETDKLLRKVKYPARERHKNRPFGFSRKTLQKDFHTLAKLGWLKLVDGLYHKVEEFPNIDISTNKGTHLKPDVSVAANFIPIYGLADMVANFAEKINGVQRFFFLLEYIVPEKLSSHIEFLQNQLKSIWLQKPVPPVKLTYCSAKKFQETREYVVYPVCICYYQRAPYLFAYGQNPWDTHKINWYDYRLDRIQKLNELKWSDVTDVQEPFVQKCLGKAPPSPDDIHNEMANALGFDFYKPSAVLVLRFQQYFYANYIENTERAQLFRPIPYKEAQRLIRTAQLKQEQRQYLLTELNSRSKTDIYCKVDYRVDDNNVVMRLRAWGPKVEVLLPWELRDRITKDIEETRKLYTNSP